jgi:quercetin dioxygenase-like cupin family protein
MTSSYLARLAVLVSLTSAAPFVLAQQAPGMNDVVKPGNERWSVNGAAPPVMEWTVIYGDPKKPGPFIFRARIPPNYRLPAHTHPDERSVTVLKGTYYSAIGEIFDEAKLEPFPSGSFYSTPANAPHYSATKGEEVIIQEMGFGPVSGMTYVNPAEDPRKP